MRENAGISLGRVAAVAPQQLAGHLGHFLGAWCVTLAALRVRALASSPRTQCNRGPKQGTNTGDQHRGPTQGTKTGDQNNPGSKRSTINTTQDQANPGTA